MHLVELFLPLNDNSGRPFGPEIYAGVRQHLTERFGGLTVLPARPPRAPPRAAGSPCTTRSSCSKS
jgi:hypothetical protein